MCENGYFFFSHSLSACVFLSPYVCLSKSEGDYVYDDTVAKVRNVGAMVPRGATGYFLGVME